MSALEQSIVAGAFADPVHDTQRTFAALMQVMSRPGRVECIASPAMGPQPLYATTAALLQTLADADTPVWFDHASDGDAVRGWLSFQTGAPLADGHGEAAFAVIADAKKLPPLSMFALGSQEYPDRSTTLLVQVPSLDASEALALRGPGIAATALLNVEGLPTGFRAAWAQNNALFPRGVDVVLLAPDSIAGLPRTTRLKAMEAA
ncbi:MAG: phosphonate C-P lyase system protein PhnH [Pseudomonadota bacterium]